MARAYVHALLGGLRRVHVLSIYAKGSAYGPWRSLIDYVPGLSDVDVHARLTEEGWSALHELGTALDIAGRAVTQFRTLFPYALHEPRPQLMFIRQLEAQREYVPPTLGSTHVLHGEAPRELDRDSFPDTSHQDARRFLADAAWVAGTLPTKVVDRPGPLLWEAVRVVIWRVGPAGPRLLTQLGVDPYEAWRMERTAVVEALSERGHEPVARDYADFYLAAWDGVENSFRSARPARRALAAAASLFERGREVLTRR